MTEDQRIFATDLDEFLTEKRSELAACAGRPPADRREWSEIAERICGHLRLDLPRIVGEVKVIPTVVGKLPRGIPSPPGSDKSRVVCLARLTIEGDASLLRIRPSGFGPRPAGVVRGNAVEAVFPRLIEPSIVYGRPGRNLVRAWLDDVELGVAKLTAPPLAGKAGQLFFNWNAGIPGRLVELWEQMLLDERKEEDMLAAAEAEIFAAGY